MLTTLQPWSFHEPAGKLSLYPEALCVAMVTISVAPVERWRDATQFHNLAA
ncbi:TPA: hypothetical protein U2Q44_003867 [Klebsiella aerogenes]|uniref:hypothetical protein n=1 Tax=Klebsiella aerogenes TaxID=548 RepID=UPI0012FEBE26|nr:hypothetical protein [Klebsiella aerogenes]ELA2170825.1 hypothetical protein [Klebsiella aerogenes]HDU4783050.1 hypothetical protein [Klebsiella aerogenes]HEM8656643.1 hypothetical protein [Klebsiella aerogenes]